MQTNANDLSENYSVIIIIIQEFHGDTSLKQNFRATVMVIIITKVYVNHDIRSLPVFTWLGNVNDLSTLPV